MNTQITIVIVNWNRQECILKLLDSLRSMPQVGLRILVVDNASTDGSAAAIRQHSLPVTLLENQENLGGTGGFNTGIRYTLELPDQEFIWLLDNDAEVTPETLDQLVGAMNRDPSIGVAGSCILSPEDNSVIVEAGGFVDRRSGIWTPNRRYQPHSPLSGRDLLDPVDYVPACSALIRVDVLRKVGSLDERFFLHWDDVDFCARARDAGFKVVSVLDSQAYHGAEKGYNPMTLYYDFRNALLYFGKHSAGLPLMRTYLSLLGGYLSSLAYFRLLGQRDAAVCLRDAWLDFLTGRYGKGGTSLAALLRRGASPKERSGDEAFPESGKVVIFAVGAYDEVVSALVKVRSISPQVSVFVAVAAERASVYQLPGVDGLIVFDLLKDGLTGKLRTIRAILRERFFCGVTAGEGFTVPYAFLLARNYIFDHNKVALQPSSVSRKGLWKLPVAMVAGKLGALLLVMPSWFAARQLRKREKEILR